MYIHVRSPLASVKRSPSREEPAARACPNAHSRSTVLCAGPQPARMDPGVQLSYLGGMSMRGVQGTRFQGFMPAREVLIREHPS